MGRPVVFAKLPLIADVFDARAMPKAGDIALLDLFRVSLPAVAGAFLTLSGSFDQLFAKWAGAGAYAQASVPLVFWIVCCVLISKREVKESPASIEGAPPHRQYLYSYSAGERLVAKLVILPALLLTVSEIGALVPNRIAGNRYVAGFLCSGVDGSPHTTGAVEALDSSGLSASKSSQLLDDQGFFFIDLKPWSRVPRLLRVAVPACRGQLLQIQDARDSADRCPAAAPRNAGGSARAFPVWTFRCD